jgi:hypothetical protein
VDHVTKRPKCTRADNVAWIARPCAMAAASARTTCLAPGRLCSLQRLETRCSSASPRRLRLRLPPSSASRRASWCRSNPPRPVSSTRRPSDVSPPTPLISKHCTHRCADGQDLPRRPGPASHLTAPQLRLWAAPAQPDPAPAGISPPMKPIVMPYTMHDQAGRLNHVLGRLAGRLQKSRTSRDDLGRLATQPNSDALAGEPSVRNASATSAASSARGA